MPFENPPAFTRSRLETPDAALVARLRPHRVLVTGAAGTLGREVAHRLAAIGPRGLLLLDQAESELFELVDGLSGAEAILGDVGNERLLDRVFGADPPRFVVHAAALKHTAELEHHPVAAVRVNVLATHALASRVQSTGAWMVLASTDKAVEPTSVMGATKAIAERIVTAIPAPGRGTVARMVNVLGSRGSLWRRIASRRERADPIEIREPGATRWILTGQDAGSLLLRGWLEPDPGSVIAAEPGAAVTVADLVAHALGSAAAATVITGLRDGEKLHERLFGVEESWTETGDRGVRRHVPPPAPPPDLSALRLAVAHEDASGTIEALAAACPSYRPSAAARGRRP